MGWTQKSEHETPSGRTKEHVLDITHPFLKLWLAMRSEIKKQKQACIWLVCGTISKSVGFINLALLEMVPPTTVAARRRHFPFRKRSLPIESMKLNFCYQKSSHRTWFKNARILAEEKKKTRSDSDIDKQINVVLVFRSGSHTAQTADTSFRTRIMNPLIQRHLRSGGGAISWGTRRENKLYSDAQHFTC